MEYESDTTMKGLKVNWIIKKSNIGDKASINHLSFIRDVNISENVAIGIGAITCNHDAKYYHE